MINVPVMVTTRPKETQTLYRVQYWLPDKKFKPIFYTLFVRTKGRKHSQGIMSVAALKSLKKIIMNKHGIPINDVRYTVWGIHYLGEEIGPIRLTQAHMDYYDPIPLWGETKEENDETISD